MPWLGLRLVRSEGNAIERPRIAPPRIGPMLRLFPLQDDCDIQLTLETSEYYYQDCQFCGA